MGDDEAEVFGEIDRLEGQLSLYRSSSEIAYLNANAAQGPVRVEPRLFNLLKMAAEFSRVTEGAFDITIAPLVRCWGFMGGDGQYPAPAEIEAALEVVGSHHLIFDDENFAIHFEIGRAHV